MVTFQFVPFQEVQTLSSTLRVNKLLNIVKDDKIVIMEGRLRKQEEADLIEITMQEISSSFSGIELSVIDPEMKGLDGVQKFKQGVANILLGDRQGLTIIGPANVVKRIVNNPDKIELFTKEAKKIKPKSAKRKKARKKRR